MIIMNFYSLVPETRWHSKLIGTCHHKYFKISIHHTNTQKTTLASNQTKNRLQTLSSHIQNTITNQQPTQWRTKGFWHLERRCELTPLSLGRLASAEGALSFAMGGLGRSPRRQRFWEHLGVNGTYFWIALTLFSTCKGRLKNLKKAHINWTRVTANSVIL